MIKLANVAKMTLIAAAIAPLFPIIALMWAAKGIEILSKRKVAAKANRESASENSWESETLIYVPTA